MPNEWTPQDLDPLLASQIFAKQTIPEPQTADQRIAWRKMHRDICDCSFGTPTARIIYIDEIETWIVAPNDRFEYNFEFWCEQLQLEPGYVRKFMLAFLQKQRQDAINNSNGKRSAENDKHRWLIKGRKTTAVLSAHLVQCLGTSCYACSRCQTFAPSITAFEENICDGPIHGRMELNRRTMNDRINCLSDARQEEAVE